MDAGGLERSSKLPKIVWWDLGTFDIAELPDVDERLERKVGVDVLLGGTAGEPHGISLYPVQEGGGQVGLGLDAGGLEVTRHDGRDCPNVWADIRVGSGGRFLAPGMVVDNDGWGKIGRQRVVSRARLGVDEGDDLVAVKGKTGAIEIAAGQMTQGTAEIAEKGAVLGAADDTLVGNIDLNVALLLQEMAERDGAGDGIRVRIIMGQDQHAGSVLDRVNQGG
jgi:hypothetical protein